MADVADGEPIGTTPCGHCILCGSPGAGIYRQLADRLFQAPGLWDLRQCPAPGCGLIWLDPMPLPQEIGKAYRHYYTHSSQAGSGGTGRLRQLYHRVKRGYWAGTYHYTNGLDSGRSRSLGQLLRLFPIRRGEAEVEIRYLPALAGGRLLDVGCGSGDWLQLMNSLGWRAEGIDFDESAVAFARKNGLEVSVGSVEQQKYPGDTFDAVTLSHVIEHVPDPVATLAECRRILKPGGRIVVATPNNASLGHRVFGQDWRGLEPPRHLHIFSPASITRAFRLAGFPAVSVRPQVARSVIRESFLLWRGGAGQAVTAGSSWGCSAFTLVFNGIEIVLVPFAPSLADCFSAVAVK